jgi:hypothetical protein
VEILGGLNACFLCRKEGHLRKDCPIIRNKTQKNTNPVNLPNYTQKIPPSSANINPMPSPFAPSQSFPYPSQTPLAQNASFTSIMDTDGFQTVTKKRKNRSSKKDSPPNIPFVSPPSVTNMTSKDKANPSVSPPSALKATTNHISSEQNPPVKVFQEISDDFIVEVIPAAPVVVNNQSPELEAFSPSMSDNEDIPTARRKGRPPGSKNKNKNNKKQSQFDFEDASPMEDIVGVEASNSLILSQ